MYACMTRRCDVCMYVCMYVCMNSDSAMIMSMIKIRRGIRVCIMHACTTRKGDVCMYVCMHACMHNNVGDQDSKGNTCLRHACMHNKKR